jgi:hypothetical protein
MDEADLYQAVLSKFRRVCDELRRDRFYGIRTPNGTLVLQESENHALIYLYIVTEGECHAVETGNEVSITPVTAVISAEMKGGIRLSVAECQTELNRYTPVWLSLDDCTHVTA